MVKNRFYKIYNKSASSDSVPKFVWFLRQVYFWGIFRVWQSYPKDTLKINVKHVGFLKSDVRKESKWNFLGVKEFFSWILISKMDSKMNLRIMTENQAADSDIRFLEKRVQRPCRQRGCLILDITPKTLKKHFEAWLFKNISLEMLKVTKSLKSSKTQVKKSKFYFLSEMVK